VDLPGEILTVRQVSDNLTLAFTLIPNDPTALAVALIGADGKSRVHSLTNFLRENNRTVLVASDATFPLAFFTTPVRIRIEVLLVSSLEEFAFISLGDQFYQHPTDDDGVRQILRSISIAACCYPPVSQEVEEEEEEKKKEEEEVEEKESLILICQFDDHDLIACSVKLNKQEMDFPEIPNGLTKSSLKEVEFPQEIKEAIVIGDDYERRYIMLKQQILVYRNGLSITYELTVPFPEQPSFVCSAPSGRLFF
jgi:hypothetical protein